MNIFSTTPEQPQQQVQVLTHPVDRGLSGMFRSDASVNTDQVIYPLVSGMDKAVVKQYFDAGLYAPVETAAEAQTRAKEARLVNEVIQGGAESQMPPEEALMELERVRQSDPLLKKFVSSATLAALRQSDNPISKRVAERKIANVFIAYDLIQKKYEETTKNYAYLQSDFVDDFLGQVFTSIPVYSLVKTNERIALANEFVTLLDSNENPEAVAVRLKEIVELAASQSYLSPDNRFSFGDFVALVTEGTGGSEADIQQVFGGLDILAVVGLAGDAGKLIAATRRNPKEVSGILMDAIKVDDPVSGAVNPSTYGESLLTPTNLIPRTPEVSTANKLTEIELRSMRDAIDIRITSGQAIDDDLFEVQRVAMRDIAIAKAEKAGEFRYIDADLVKDEFENVRFVETFGTTKGRAFTSKVAAQKYADQILGEVVPSSTNPKEFLVQKSRNVPTGALTEEALSFYRSTDDADLGDGIFAYIGSPQSQTSASNVGTLLQGEFARAKALATIDKPLLAAIKAAGGQEPLSNINKVFLAGRDGEFANLRKAPTRQEFAGLYTRINGKPPTEEELNLFEVIQDRHDTDWFLSADLVFKREVNRGAEVYRLNDIEVTGVRASKDNLGQGVSVWDEDKGRYVAAGELEEGKIIIKLDDPMDFGGQLNDYVAMTVPAVRGLRVDEVMGYNWGGSRLYNPNQTNFIVKQSQEITLAGGRTVTGRPTSILAAKTEQEAVQAVDNINTIIDAVHAKVNPRGTKIGTSATGIKTGGYAFSKEEYLRAVESIGSKTDELDEVIASVSGWNTNVHSVKTLVEHFSELKLDLRQRVDYVPDGEPLLKGDQLDGLTFKEALTSPGILKRGDQRRDSVLVGYGGKPLSTRGPVESIQRSLMSSVAKQTNVAYEYQAINGLLKKATEDGLIININELRGLPIRQKLRMAKLSSKGAGKKLRIEQTKILARLEKTQFISDFYRSRREAFANFLYDRNFKGLAAKADAWSADPITGARGIVFDSYLGMLAPDQLWVQASQINNIIAMADKTTGLKAVAATIPIRMAIRNGHKGVAVELSGPLSKFLDIQESEFVDIVESFKQSGKGHIQASLADLGEDAGGVMVARKIRELGRTPYNEGELAARITAHTTASVEYLKKNPGKSLMSNSARRWVMQRSDVLTNSMSSSSRGRLEQLPFMQFMSYQFRMTEFMFGGIAGGKKVLSTKEKTRLGGVHMALYGAAAIPALGYMVDRINWTTGLGMDEELADMIRNGWIDGMLEYFTGVETEVGRRLAWGEGFYQLIQDFTTNGAGETFLGPLGGVTGGILSSTAKLAWDIKVGGYDFLAEDSIDVLRSIKSVNLGYNAYMAVRYGQYRTKGGTTIDTTITPMESAAIALGVPIEKVNEAWRTIDMKKRDKTYQQSVGMKISGLFADLGEEYRIGSWDSDRANNIRKAISMSYSLHTPLEVSEIDRYVDKKGISLNESLIVDILRNEQKKAIQ